MIGESGAFATSRVRARLPSNAGDAWTARRPSPTSTLGWCPAFSTREVIVRALEHRQAGESRERAAAATADGQLDPELVKRWEKRFGLIDGHLVAIDPPLMAFPTRPATSMLAAPAGSRSPDLQQEDQWARSPPSRP